MEIYLLGQDSSVLKSRNLGDRAARNERNWPRNEGRCCKRRIHTSIAALRIYLKCGFPDD